MLALAKPRETKLSALFHESSPRDDAALGSPLFQIVSAAAIVSNACKNVPDISHARVFEPMRSPKRAIYPPTRYERSDMIACWSALTNVKSAFVEVKKRPTATASWTVFPVWKPHHKSTAVNGTEFLAFCLSDQHK